MLLDIKLSNQFDFSTVILMIQRFFTALILIFSLINSKLFLSATEMTINPVPIAKMVNPTPHYTLINSVDFHPTENFFCVTYTHANKVAFYKMNTNGTPHFFQSLINPESKLSEPQHAAFTRDGKKMMVANWTNQTFTLYLRRKNEFYSKKPIAVNRSPAKLIYHKPHGLAFSPCGNYFAIAYGAASNYGRAIALFHITNDGKDSELTDLLENPESLLGIPKGITFSPNGSSLLVTFSDTNSLAIFDLTEQNSKIQSIPRQVIQGPETGISRPEDVKISSDGTYCAISNSDQHNVTFYRFDPICNVITDKTPIYILQNPEADLCFPHGLAFSPDGSFLLVTEFGLIDVSEDGGISWDGTVKANQSRTKIFSLKSN